MVGRAEPFQFTAAPLANPLPFTVNVKTGPPAVVDAGLSELIVAPADTVKLTGAEVTPPLLTVMLTVEGVAMRLAATLAVSWPGLANIVGSAEPFQFTVAPLANPLPFTVNVKAGPPAVALGGKRELTETGDVIVSVTVPVVEFPLASETLIVDG